MDIKEETYQFLSDLGIQYEQAEHASIPTMEALDEAVLLPRIFCSLIARKQNSIFS